jgi:hypothetical protein
MLHRNIKIEFFWSYEQNRNLKYYKDLAKSVNDPTYNNT